VTLKTNEVGDFFGKILFDATVSNESGFTESLGINFNEQKEATRTIDLVEHEAVHRLMLFPFWWDWAESFLAGKNGCREGMVGKRLICSSSPPPASFREHARIPPSVLIP